MFEHDNKYLQWLIFLAVCMLGSLSRYMNYLSKTKEKFLWLDLIARLFCSAFAGVITSYLCVEANLSNAMTAALIGLSGYMGAEAIQLLLCVLKNFSMKG